MELIPAIDLLDGKVVRLERGRYDAVTVYDADPVAVALRFEEAGARRLHVVDLTGARAGEPAHVGAVEAILARTSLAVQVGGGVRTVGTARRWLAAGAARVVFGTAALKAPEVVREIAEDFPRAVVVAVDARDGLVAVEGWTEGSTTTALSLVTAMEPHGVEAFLYTNIDRDGTREGPDVEGTRAIQDRVAATVIASGGIGSLDHVRALAAAGVRAAVCGRALYSGAFTLNVGLRVARGVP